MTSTVAEQTEEPEIPFEGEEPAPTQPEPEPEEPTEPEPEAEPEEEPEQTEPEAVGPTPEQVEKVFKSIEKRATTYMKFVNETAEENGIPLEACGLCAEHVPGWIISPQVKPLDESQTEAIQTLLGIGIGPRYVQAPNAEMCPICDGWGEVLTGSRVHKQQRITCLRCVGRGYIGEAANLAPADVAQLPNLSAVTVEEEPEPTPMVDAWGTPKGHPEYGVMPQFRDPGWQERVEAWKAGEPAPVTE